MKWITLFIVTILASCSGGEDNQVLQDDTTSTGLVLITAQRSNFQLNSANVYIAVRVFNDTDNDVTRMDCWFFPNVGQMDKPAIFDVAAGQDIRIETLAYIGTLDDAVSTLEFDCEYRSGFEDRAISGLVDLVDGD